MTTKELDALLDDHLGSHPGDPANACWLEPLDDPEEEVLAHGMAGAIYGACMDELSDMTDAQADYVWEQCLINSRRMLGDEDYASLF